MTIGERLKLVRGTASQDEFSKRLGVSKAAVGAYERNAQMPGSAFIIAVCERYDIEPRWLLTGRGPMRPGVQAARDASDASAVPAGVAGGADCARCRKLEVKLSEMEAQRDGLLERLGRAWDENRQLWSRNADLRERLASLEERAISAKPADFSEQIG